MRVPTLALVFTAVAGSIAHAETPPEPEPVTPAEPAEPAEPDWAAAPPPTQASGVARADGPSTRERMRWLPRVLLFLPRWIVWGVGQPVRGAAYAYENYDLATRVEDTIYDDQRRYGGYPVAAYETGFGVTVGARLLHNDLFGARERVKLRVNVGGRFRQAYGINVRSGNRFGDRVAVELDSSYERRPLERFYGLGNGTAIDTRPDMLIDPATDDTAFATRFREDLVRNVVTVDAHLVGALRNRLSGALMLRDFSGTGEPDSIDAAYQTDRLVGFANGVNNLYIENELVYDSRRPATPYQSRALDGAGWLASAHVGVTKGIDGDRSDFFTYGGEVQHYFDLFDGSRVLALRAMVEAVGGTDGRTDGEIAFIDLPRLGGSDYLRGYPNARFRDRIVTLATAEYSWDLGNYLGAYTFVDVGRPWRTFASMGDFEPDELRVGFGGGVQIHTGTSFLTRMQLAGSKDGDVFFELALSPSFGRRERAGRY